MNKKTIKNEENVIEKKVEKTYSKKDEFEVILEKIRKMSEAIELHSNVKKSVDNNEVDDTYLKYIENALEDKFFSDVRFDKIKSKTLLEVVCPDLIEVENFDINKLTIEDIGSHYEEDGRYIDKICIYDNKFINIFGVNEQNQDKVIKYDVRKFTRADMIEVIKGHCEEGKKVELKQYDEYYVVEEEDRVKVFSERKVISLVKVEETIFDKIKLKLLNFFNKSLFAKKTFLPKLELIYDTNPNRFKDFECNTSKKQAKNRMKALLNKEREITRSIAE